MNSDTGGTPAQDLASSLRTWTRAVAGRPAAARPVRSTSGISGPNSQARLPGPDPGRPHRRRPAAELDPRGGARRAPCRPVQQLALARCRARAADRRRRAVAAGADRQRLGLGHLPELQRQHQAGTAVHPLLGGGQEHRRQCPEHPDRRQRRPGHRHQRRTCPARDDPGRRFLQHRHHDAAARTGRWQQGHRDLVPAGQLRGDPRARHEQAQLRLPGRGARRQRQQGGRRLAAGRHHQQPDRPEHRPLRPGRPARLLPDLQRDRRGERLPEPGDGPGRLYGAARGHRPTTPGTSRTAPSSRATPGST